MLELLHGDCLKLLAGFNPGTFAGIITDPPYASGGATKGDKAKPTAEKYTSTKRACPYPDFEGDAMDQRSWTHFMREVFAGCRRVATPGAVLVSFIDWRQLPALTDALQWAGWIWRGTAVWDKLSSRPQRGRFRQQAEFILWASNGVLPIDRPVPVLPGVFSCTNPQPNVRIHQTQKPLELMRQLVRIVEPGGRILDPFAGSGTTLEAAQIEGYDATGIEVSMAYYQVGLEHLRL